MDIHNKVTIITGASEGIGRATALLLAQHGAKVVVAARSVDKLETLAQEIRTGGGEALVVPTDMRQREAVYQLIETAFQHYGRIDILVNNAGQGASGALMDFDPGHYQQLMELNVYGPLYAMQAVVPKMRLHGGGLILNISSTVTRTLFTGVGAYSSTKFALNSLTDTARAELKPENIRVIGVFPDVTVTSFRDNLLVHGQMPQRADGGAFPVPDTAEKVAQRILEAVQDEPQYQYMDE